MKKGIAVQCCRLLFVGLSFGLPVGKSGAQSASALAWETALYYGTLWRHTPKLTIRTGQPVWGQEWGFRLQTRGRKAWQAAQRFPAFGLALAHFPLGDQSHGTAWGLLPHLNVPVLRSGRWMAAFRLGTGLGYVTRPYNSFRNPGQNAIGSHWNNFTQFRLGGEYRLNAFWRAQAGVVLSHFSNGASTLPNFGVNLPGAFLALNWSPLGIREPEFVRLSENKPLLRRWGGLLSGGLALIEYAVIDGPRYPVWALSGAGYVQLNPVNRLLAGLDYEFNRAVYAFGIRAGQFQNKREARRGGTRLAVTLADEFLFGALGVTVLAGIYTGGHINQVLPFSWYSKLTTRYYFPPLFHTSLRLHAGISLKAHKTTAELISMNTGFVF